MSSILKNVLLVYRQSKMANVNMSIIMTLLMAKRVNLSIFTMVQIPSWF